MGMGEWQDGMLYKLHHQKLGNTEKTVRINGAALTRQKKFAILNMLGGHVAVFFAARQQENYPNKMITLGQLVYQPTKGYRLFLISNIILTSLS